MYTVSAYLGSRSCQLLYIIVDIAEVPKDSRSSMTTPVTAKDVAFFWPNIIGYGRVIGSLSSFTLMVFLPEYWLLSVFLYLSNFIGDLFDGLVARKLDQCSTYGGVLDMITDRCSTQGLLFILAIESEKQTDLPVPVVRMIFLLLGILDISSHWVQTYSALTTGHHHKSEEGNKGRNFLVRWFYQYYYFFGYLCVGAEFTYVFTYARMHFDDSSNQLVFPEIVRTALNGALLFCIPGCAAKQVVNLAQLFSGFEAIARHDAEIINSKAT